jgi:hypothetical protein
MELPKIIRADAESDTELMVEFSNGTTAIYTLDQLLKLTPDLIADDEQEGKIDA